MLLKYSLPQIFLTADGDYIHAGCLGVISDITCQLCTPTSRRRKVIWVIDFVAAPVSCVLL